MSFSWLMQIEKHKLWKDFEEASGPKWHLNFVTVFQSNFPILSFIKFRVISESGNSVRSVFEYLFIE